MKVVVIGHTYLVSFNRGKLRHLARRKDVDLTLICPGSWMEPDFGLRLCEPESAFPIQVLSTRGTGNVRRYNYSVPELIRTIRKISPDVVHLESEAASLASLQVALTKIAHDYRLVLFVWDNLPSEGWRFRQVGAVSYRGTDYLIAGSNDALTIARKQGYQGPAAVLPQVGVDPAMYTRVRAVDPWGAAKGLRIGFVGRLDRKKGVDLLIRAVAQTENALLTLVGDGDHREEFEALAGELEIADRCAFVGGVPHDGVPQYIKGMDALVLPSVATRGWVEQFGHVLIEAMAANVPIIGSGSGVIPDVIGDAGLVFPEGDVVALAKQIRRLQSEEGLALRLVELGARRVRERFSDEAVAEKTYAIWSEVARCT